MIAANVQAAKFLDRSKIPALYRVHAPPPESKYEDLLEFLREFALKLPPYTQVTPADYSALLKKTRKRPDAGIDRVGVAAFAIDGGLQPERRRALRACAGCLRTFHFADPALSGSARASRDPLCVEQGQAYRTTCIRRATWLHWARIVRTTSAAPKKPNVMSTSATSARGWKSMSAANSTASFPGSLHSACSSN